MDVMDAIDTIEGELDRQHAAQDKIEIDKASSPDKFSDTKVSVSKLNISQKSISLSPGAQKSSTRKKDEGGLQNSASKSALRNLEVPEATFTS